MASSTIEEIHCQPVTTKIYVPTVERKTGQVLSIGETSVQLMDLSSYATIDVP